MKTQQYAHWMHLARQHWKEHLPQKFKRLRDSNQLHEALRLAAEQTADLMEQLQSEGFDQMQAWEMVRNEYLLLPPEADEAREPVGSQGYGAMLELQRIRSELSSLED